MVERHAPDDCSATGSRSSRCSAISSTTPSSTALPAARRASSFAARPDSDGSVLIEIEDNGRGIARPGPRARIRFVPPRRRRRTSRAKASASPTCARSSGASAARSRDIGAWRRHHISRQTCPATYDTQTEQLEMSRGQARHHRHGRGRRGPCASDRAEHPPRRRQQRDHRVHQRHQALAYLFGPDGSRRGQRRQHIADPARPQSARHDGHRHPGEDQGQRAHQALARRRPDHDGRRARDPALLRSRRQRLHHQAGRTTTASPTPSVSSACSSR